MKKLILVMIAILVFASQAYAIGVSPARTTVDFQPELIQEITITVINTEHRDSKATVYTEDNSSMLEISEKEIEFKANEPTKDIKLKLTLPKKLKPGIKDIDIFIKQKPSEEFPSPLFVGADLAVVSQIRIRIPYPGKYAEVGDIEVTNARVNSTVQFILPVINFGSQEIKKLNAKIKIFGPDNKTLAEISTQETSLEPKKRVLLNAQWNSEKMNPGVYYAYATISYDGEKTNKERAFTLGRLYIKLLSVVTGNNYQFGGIARLDLLLQSEWNEKIEDIYGELNIKKEDQLVANLKTPSISLLPYEPTTLSAYWDTAGVSEGEYFLNLKLRYEGIEQNINMISDLSFNGLKTRILGTGEAIFNPLSAKTILPIAVVLLIIINIFVVGYYKRKSKGFKYRPPKNGFNPKENIPYRPIKQVEPKQNIGQLPNQGPPQGNNQR